MRVISGISGLVVKGKQVVRECSLWSSTDRELQELWTTQICVGMS